MRRRDDQGPDVGRRALCARARVAITMVVISFVMPGAMALAAPPVSDKPSYRIFLTDGTPLLSYGEFTRVGGQVVFAVPVGRASDPDALQVVSLPADIVDWDRTSRYSDAVRLRRYAGAQGEHDYLALTGVVARGLSDMAFTADVATKLRIANDLRRQLAAWPAGHFGYRAGDVRELAGIVEEAISDIRAGAGEQAFDLNLVAMIAPPDEPLLPEPSLAESIRLASLAAGAAAWRPERISLQQAILLVLDRRKAELPPAVYRTTGRSLKKALGTETRLDRQYEELVARSLAQAGRYVAAGDVQAIERLVEDVRRQDARLGAQRPDEVTMLLTAVASKREAARAMRLSLDRWQFRQDSYKTYRETIDRHLNRARSWLPAFDAIRQMSGLDPRRLPELDRRVRQTEIALLPLAPPGDLRGAHDTLVASLHLMRETVRLWRGALASDDETIPRNASAAAAGAMLLFDSARSSIAEYFRRPVPP